MPARTLRSVRPPAAGARFPSDVVADNVRALRLLRRLSQVGLAARMARFHAHWNRSTVGDVERGLRSVTVDELVALAAALESDVPRLLHPAGVEGRDARSVDIGDIVLDPHQFAHLVGA